MHRFQIRILAQEFDEVGLRALAPGGIAHQLAAVEFAQREIEAQEVAEVGQRLGAERTVREQQAQRLHHHCRIAVPVEEVVRIGIVGAQHRRGDDRAVGGAHLGAEARPPLDHAGGGDAAQHRLRCVAVLPFNPLVERPAQDFPPCSR